MSQALETSTLLLPLYGSLLLLERQVVRREVGRKFGLVCWKEPSSVFTRSVVSWSARKARASFSDKTLSSLTSSYNSSRGYKGKGSWENRTSLSPWECLACSNFESCQKIFCVDTTNPSAPPTIPSPARIDQAQPSQPHRAPQGSR